MKKEHVDRLAEALEFANESAEYHVRNYADGRPLPVTGRDMVEGTYRGVHFRCSYENMEYEYYDEDSDGDRQKKIGKLFDEEKNIKNMNDVEAYLDKYLRMLQEVLDAALLI